MPPVGFEPTISAGKHVLDRAATATGNKLDTKRVSYQVETATCFGTSDVKFIVRCVLGMTHSVCQVVTSGSCRWVSGELRGGWGVQPPRNSEVLTKLSRIPSSVENTSVTLFLLSHRAFYSTMLIKPTNAHTLCIF
jgi:hypothetical protein